MCQIWAPWKPRGEKAEDHKSDKTKLIQMDFSPVETVERGEQKVDSQTKEKKNDEIQKVGFTYYYYLKSSCS